MAVLGFCYTLSLDKYNDSNDEYETLDCTVSAKITYLESRD